MKVLLLWTGGVVPAYWEFFSALGSRCVLRVLAPHRWVHGSTEFTAQDWPAPPAAFTLVAARFWRLGSAFYLVPGFALQLLRFGPDLVYCMDEADRPATVLHLWLARLLRPRALRVNYNLQNLVAPRYHRFRHRLSLRCQRAWLHGAVATSGEAEAVLRARGFALPTARIPLFASEREFFPASPVEKANLRRRFGAPEARTLIVYAGSLARAKGVDSLLHALPRHPGLYLLLAGSGELEAEARALPVTAGKWLGPLHLPALRALYQAGDCVILPSRDTPVWKEQVGRALLEGILCGCLGLGSDGGFIPELLGTPETLFAQGNAEDLHRLLAALPLPQTPRLRERQHARVLATYTASVTAAATFAFFQDLSPSEKAP